MLLQSGADAKLANRVGETSWAIANLMKFSDIEKSLLQKGAKFDSGLEILFYGNIPNGAGLSSSASIELVSCIIAKNTYGIDLDMIELVKLSQKVENEFIVYRWDYYSDDEFFEFRIEQSSITNETILKITDFADKADMKDQERLWNSQVADLKHRIGSN